MASTSGTIADLSSALKCAEKCSCCSDLLPTLRRLEAMIKLQNQKIALLEKQINQSNSNGGNKNNPSSSSLDARVAAIEKYINTFDKACKDVTESLKLIREIFKI